MRRFSVAVVTCAVASLAVAGWLASRSGAQDTNRGRRTRSSAFQRASSQFGSSSSRSESFRQELERRRAGALAASTGQASAPTAKLADTRNARQVHAEILFVEITAADLSKAKLPKLTGKTADVEKALIELKSHGQLKSLQRYKMSALDGHRSMTQIGDMKAVASGTTVLGGGRGGAPGGRFGGARVSRSYQMRNFGTMLSLTPAVEPSGSVVLDLSFEQSGPVGEDDSPKEPGETTAPAGSRTLTFRNTLRVAAGEFLTVTSSTFQSKKGTTQILVLATARADAKPAAGAK